MLLTEDHDLKQLEVLESNGLVNRAKVLARSPGRIAPAHRLLFDAGLDAAVLGDVDAGIAHGVWPTTEEEKIAWIAGKLSVGMGEE